MISEKVWPIFQQPASFSLEQKKILQTMNRRMDLVFSPDSYISVEIPIQNAEFPQILPKITTGKLPLY